MALDTRIPLLGQTIGPQTLVNASNLRQADTQNELQRFALQQQKNNQPLVAAQRDRDIQLAHLGHNVALMERVGTFVDNGDTKGGLQFLQGIQQQKRSTGQQTPLIDAVIGDLQSNNMESFKAKRAEARETGVRYGWLQPMETEAANNLFGAINPKDYTPQSISAFQASGDYGDLVAVSDDPSADSPWAKINPSLYTPESVQRFEQTNQYGDLVTKAGGDESPFARIDVWRYTPESLAVFERTGKVSDLVAKEDPAKAPESPWAKINPKDFTPESVTLFAQTGNFGDLRAVAETDGGTGVITTFISRDNQVRVLRRDSPEAQVLIDSGAWGVAEIRTDPIDGSVTMWNPLTQQGVPFDIPYDAPPPQDVPAEQTLWNQADLAGGPVASLAERGSFITSIMFGVTAGDTIQARQTFNNEKNALLRALALNPRYPVGEIERLDREINITPSIWNTGPMLQDRSVAIHRSLARRAADLEAGLSNRDLSRRQRNDDAASARSIRQFLEVLGVPESALTPTLTPAQQERLRELEERYNVNGQ